MNVRKQIALGLIETKLRFQLLREGKKKPERDMLLEGFNENLVTTAQVKSGISIPNWEDEQVDHSLGSEDEITDTEHVWEAERPIIDAILAFLNSEAGKALIQALMALLLGLI